MRKNFIWKMLVLFCFTFLIGFLSFNFSTAFIETKDEKKTKYSGFIGQQKIKKVLQNHTENEINCVPADGRLKYEFIQEESTVLVPVNSSKTKVLPEIVKEIDGIEKKLQENKNLEKKQKDRLKERLNDLHFQNPFYNREKYGDIGVKDLLYREVCKRN